MRKIVLFPDKILRTKTKKIDSLNKKTKKEIEDLVEVLKNSENGAGLASTQIGYTSRFFGVKEGKAIKLRINPKILRVKGDRVYPEIEAEVKEEFLEGCLSFPDLFGTVKRYLLIEAEWEEIEAGKLVKKQQVLSGFEAIVFQHEGDHLDGVLFVDHIKRDGGRLYRIEGKKKEEIDIREIC